MKKTIVLSLVLAATSVFAGDPYLVVGDGNYCAKGNDAPIAKKLSLLLGKKFGAPVTVEAIPVTNAALMAAQKGRSFAGVVCIPGVGYPVKNEAGAESFLIKTTDNSKPAPEQVAAMNKLLDEIKTKSVVAVSTSGWMYNYKSLQAMFGDRAAVVETRDAPLSDFWGNYAPVASERIVLALERAADPEKRKWLHPFPGKVTRDGSDLILDMNTPALQGKSLVITDTLKGMYYVRHENRSNWVRAEAQLEEGNRIRLTSKVKHPTGIQLNWWHMSPYANVDHLSGAPFEILLDD